MRDLASTDNRSGRTLTPPSHHPAAELLIDYVAGANTPAETLLIDLHLAFCAECRQSVDVLFIAGGALLDALPAEHVAPQLFNKTLAAIDRVRRVGPVPPVNPVPAFAAEWPHPLGDYLARHGLRNWCWLPAGFRAVTIPFPASEGRVFVLKAPGGRGPFRHTHANDEWTVTLEGGYTDEIGTYGVGDFVSAGSDVDHTVVAERGEGCVCVLLMRGLPIYTSWAGKLLQPFMKA